MAHVNLNIKDTGNEVAIELLEKLGVDVKTADVGSVVIKEWSAGQVAVTYSVTTPMQRADFQPFFDLLVLADSHARSQTKDTK